MENTNKVGTDHIKAALQFAITLGKGISETFKDGFQPLTDTLKLLPTLMQLSPIIENKAQLVEEFKDLTDEEREEIKKWAKENFDIADDRLEAIIEKSAGLVLEVMGLIDAFKVPAADQGSTDGKSN